MLNIIQLILFNIYSFVLCFWFYFLIFYLIFYFCLLISFIFLLYNFFYSNELVLDIFEKSYLIIINDYKYFGILLIFMIFLVVVSMFFDKVFFLI
jgi:hypothetical protein